MGKFYQCRAVQPEDFDFICTFPQDAEVAFYMFPSGVYPLTADQLAEAAAKRWKPTVVTDKAGRVAGYANMYGVEEGNQGWLGNVIVAPEARGKGAAEVLIREMIQIAVTELGLQKLKLGCHNTNTRAMLFYHRIGFKPIDIKPMKNHLGKTIGAIIMELDL